MNVLRNAGFNFAGALLPAVALFASLPLVLQRLGPSGYGSLVLVTAIVGYAALLDVNASAGVVQVVAGHQARNEPEAARAAAGLGLAIHIAVGLLGAVLLLVLAGPLVRVVFDVPVALQSDMVLAVRVAAAGFLLGQVQQVLQGVPQALQRFDLSGRFDAVFGSLVPLVTLAVALAGGGLVAIIVARTLVSAAHVGLLWRLARSLLPGLVPAWPEAAARRTVLRFSVWAWLQRLAAVTQAQADKLLLGALRSLHDLTAYVVPATLVQRPCSLLFRLVQVMFPLSSALAAADRVDELRERALDAMRYNAWLHGVVCALLALFAPEWLHHWLGPQLPPEAPRVLVLLALAAWVDALTQVPSLVNDGLGHPQRTGATALLRAAVTVAASALALRLGGSLALAWAQVLVAGLATVLFLGWLHRHTLPWSLRRQTLPALAPAGALMAPVMALALWHAEQPPLALAPFGLVLGLTTVTLATLGWFGVLRAPHRVRLRAALAGRVR